VGIQSCVIPSAFSTKTYTFLIINLRGIPPLWSSLNCITLTVVEEYKFWCPSLCNFLQPLFTPCFFLCFIRIFSSTLRFQISSRISL
jgi:hypothetical protein